MDWDITQLVKRCLICVGPLNYLIPNTGRGRECYRHLKYGIKVFIFIYCVCERERLGKGSWWASNSYIINDGLELLSFPSSWHYWCAIVCPVYVVLESRAMAL